MATENRKARDKAKLAKYQERLAAGGGRQCQAENCFKKAAGSGKYCGVHHLANIKFNNPLGKLPAQSLYQQDIDDVRSLVARFPDHQGPVLAVKLIRAWLKAAVDYHVYLTDKENTKVIIARKCPAYRAALKFIEREVDMNDWFFHVTGLMLYLLRGGRCTAPRELVYTAAAGALRFIGGLEDKHGKRTRSWPVVTLRELALKLIEPSLLPLCINMREGVARQADLERLADTVARIPFRPAYKGFTFYSFEEVPTDARY